jgi:hypothetical protein
MACSFDLAPLPSFYRWWGQEHGRTIPLCESKPDGIFGKDNAETAGICWDHADEI